MQFYKRDPAAALASMAELNLEQRGLYNSIIDLLYAQDGWLEDDDARVARMLSVHPRTYRKVKAELIALGKIWISGGKLTAKRVERELKEAASFSERQRNNALKRWEEERKLKHINGGPMPPAYATGTTSISRSISRESLLGESQNETSKKRTAEKENLELSPQAKATLRRQ